jgi:hypothetical protein
VPEQAAGGCWRIVSPTNCVPEDCVTAPDHRADRERRRELQPVVGELLMHMHNHNRAAVQVLLEQQGYFDSADQARQFVMAVGDAALLLLELAAGSDDQVVKLLTTFTDVAEEA